MPETLGCSIPSADGNKLNILGTDQSQGISSQPGYGPVNHGVKTGFYGGALFKRVLNNVLQVPWHWKTEGGLEKNRCGSGVAAGKRHPFPKYLSVHI